MRSTLLGAVLAVGCTVEPTQLVVVVHTDMDVPAVLGAFSVSVEGPGARPVSISGRGRDQYGVPLTLASPSDLPATFGIRPRDGDASRSVTVRATAFAGGAPLFETRAITSFVEGEQLRLDLFLADLCRTRTCEPNQTCTLGGCSDPYVPAASLPQWTGTTPAPSPGDAGVPVAPGWPRVVAWADEPAGDVSVTDAVALDGAVVLLGTALGHTWVEGDPAGPTEVDATTRRAWLICMEADGSFCGLALLGSDEGAFLGFHGTRDALGRLLIAGTFTGSPSIDGQALDSGPAGRAAIVARGDLATDATEVGLLETPSGLSVSAIAALESGAVILSLSVDDRRLEVTPFDGRTYSNDLPSAGAYAVVLDATFRYLGATAQPDADATVPAAATAGGVEGRSAVAVEAGFVIDHFREGEVNPWGGPYINTTGCVAMAAATAGDGTSAVTCSATGPVAVGGSIDGQAGDVWLGLWDDPSVDVPQHQHALGGAGEEVVLDATGGEDGTLYFAGRFTGQADIEGLHVDGADDPDAFLFALHIEDAELLVDRLEGFRSSGADEATAVAVDATLGVVVAGRLGAPTELDGAPLGVEGATSQAWVHRLSP